MKIEKRKISDLKNWENNPRTISKEAFERLKKQIAELEPYKPLLTEEDGTVLGGNMRLRAFREMGIKEIECSVVKAPTEEMKLKYALSDNDQVGKTDTDTLANLIGSIPDLDLSDYAVHLEEPTSINDLLDSFKEVVEDEVPEVSDEPAISKLGEVYQLGRHRLMCGDSTKIEDVEKLMDGKKADMVFTDPPYSVNYGADQDILNKKSGNKSKLVARPIIGDELTTEECAEKIWRPAFRNLYESAKDDCSFYMTMCQGGDQMMMMMMMMMSEKWQIKHELIWVKSSPVFSMGRLDYDYQHEPILFGWKKKHNFYGSGQFLKSIWQIDKPSKSELHPTMKPIELIVNAIKNSSKQDDIVLDLFGGSGSTLIACEQTDRICYMMELDPKYCDVIRKRYQNFIDNNSKK